MNIVKATKKYEEWLGQQLQILEGDLRLKHERMAESQFSFFRATFYRWLQVWKEVCPDLGRVPQLLSVGDCMWRTLARGVTRTAGWFGE